jgi:L-ascorbate metabolism protein UlaG (beta-lactamase superfamily)
MGLFNINTKKMKRLVGIFLIPVLNLGMVLCQTTVSLTWFGQSTFLMKTGGVKILMDPVNPGMAKADVPDTIDLVTISHEHGDHNYVQLAKGNPTIIHGLEGTEFAKVNTVFRGVPLRTVESFHDNQQGTQRGKNAIFVFDLQGLKIVHLGDLGHLLTDAEIASIGHTDILFIPVGAGPTLDLPTAIEVIKQLKPMVVIPMHYTPADAPAGGFRLGSVEDFIKAAGSSLEVRYGGHTETFTAGKLPAKTTLMVMKTTE